MDGGLVARDAMDARWRVSRVVATPPGGGWGGHGGGWRWSDGATNLQGIHARPVTIIDGESGNHGGTITESTVNELPATSMAAGVFSIFPVVAGPDRTGFDDHGSGWR
jgi:hypothetical protein